MLNRIEDKQLLIFLRSTLLYSHRHLYNSRCFTLQTFLVLIRHQDANPQTLGPLCMGNSTAAIDSFVIIISPLRTR